MAGQEVVEHPVLGGGLTKPDRPTAGSYLRGLPLGPPPSGMRQVFSPVKGSDDGCIVIFISKYADLPFGIRQGPDRNRGLLNGPPRGAASAAGDGQAPAEGASAPSLVCEGRPNEADLAGGLHTSGTPMPGGGDHEELGGG